MRNIFPNRKLNYFQFQKFYHGSNVGPEVIMKEGLKASNPSAEINAQYGEDPDTEDLGHPTGVYMAEDRKTAEQYGRHIYSIELPIHYDQAKWGWTESEGSVWRGDIHPYLIRYEGED